MSNKERLVERVECEWEHWRSSDQWKRGECFIEGSGLRCEPCAAALRSLSTPSTKDEDDG